MSEESAKHFDFPTFINPVLEILSELLVNDTKTGYKISLNGLGMTKVKSGGVSMMLKTGTEVAQDYTFFN